MLARRHIISVITILAIVRFNPSLMADDLFPIIDFEDHSAKKIESNTTSKDANGTIDVNATMQNLKLIDFNGTIDSNATDSNKSILELNKTSVDDNYTQGKVPVLIDALYATSENNITIAEGGVNASGKGYFLKAERVVYDKNQSIAEAFGNVFALDGSQSYMMCDYAKVNVDTKKGYFKPFFGKNMVDNMWTVSNDANGSDGYYRLKNAISSSCDVTNPDWYIDYDRGTIDKTQQWMHLYGATLHIGDIPVFYSPYMAFSFDKSRHSGLLRPTVGYGASDGFIYSQPIYFVTDPDAPWDFELTPQIRTKRGNGADGVFRFIDSKYSSGSIKAGYFKDYSSYQQKYNLKNDSHYGGSILYNRTNVFAPTSGEIKDGLYINANYLNDIDYQNLQYNDILDPVVPSITTQSTINYFLQDSKNFLGIYNSYSINTAAVNNNSTLQLLPKVQLHRTVDTIGNSNIIYSGDYKASRFSRPNGLNATEQQFTLPISIYNSFLDDFLQLKAGTEFYSNNANFFNQGQVQPQLGMYKYNTNSYNVEAATTLLRQFDDFTHTIDLSLFYTRPGYRSQNYLPTSTQWNDLTSQIVLNSSVQNENTIAKLVQFFYDANDKPIISHLLSARAYHSNNNYTSNISAIENDLIYYYGDKVQIENDIFIRPEDSKVLSSTVTARIEEDYWRASLSQIFNTNAQIISPNNTQTLSAQANFWELKLGYRITRYGTVEGGYAYDIQAGANRGWFIQYGEKKPCIGYNIGIKSQIVPIMTSSSSSSMYNLVAYFNISLSSIGSVGQQYAIKSYKQ